MAAFDWRASEVAAPRRHKQKPAVVAEPVEIADPDHEVVTEPAAAIDVAKATGRGARAASRESPGGGSLDSVWLAKLSEKGPLRPSFVPPAPSRQRRDYTWLHEYLTRDRSRY
jgi:hypothetical protein